MARLSQDPSNLAPFVITPSGKHQLRRVQSVNSSTDRPSTQEREVGNESIVGTTFDPPDVSVSLEANLVNSRLLAIMGNRNPNSTWTGITIQDLLGQCDVDINLVQRNTARTNWLQSVYMRQASLGSYSISAGTDSSATETFEFNTDNKTAFERYVHTDLLTAGSNGQTSFTLTQTPIALTRGKNAGNKAISVQLAAAGQPSTFLVEGADNDFTISGTTLTLTASAAAMVASGDGLAVSYQVSTPPGGDTFQPKDTISPAAIRGYPNIPVTLKVLSQTLPIRGMQSIEATMNLNTNVEVGMGSQAIGSERVLPAEVTGNFTLFAEDYTTEKVMIAGATNSADTDYPIDAYREDLIVVLDFKHPETGTILRTDTLSGLTVTGDGRDIGVGSAVGKTFNFSAATDFGWYNDKWV
jgi:hypothetical protein